MSDHLFVRNLESERDAAVARAEQAEQDYRTLQFGWQGQAELLKAAEARVAALEQALKEIEILSHGGSLARIRRVAERTLRGQT